MRLAGPMTAHEFASALGFALDHVTVTDTGASQALTELLEAVAGTDEGTPERAAAIAAARAQYLADEGYRP